MLQRALATLLCLLGIAAIGLGVASATVWRSSDTLSASLRATDGVVVTEPGVLELAADQVEVRARASAGEVVLAIGSSDDVEAWVGTDPATWVSGLADRTTLASGPSPAASPSATATAEPSATPTDAATSQAATPSETATEPSATQEPVTPEAEPSPPANPDGSDLWIAQAVGTPRAELAWTGAPGRWSALAVATEGGPVTLTLTWPQVVTTPWRTPGLVVGSLLLVAGLAWWALLLLQRYRPHALVGVVATVDRWRSALPGRRATEPDPFAPREPGPAGGAEQAGTGASAVQGSGHEPPSSAADDAGAQAAVGGRRARRLHTAEQRAVPSAEQPVRCPAASSPRCRAASSPRCPASPPR